MNPGQRATQQFAVQNFGYVPLTNATVALQAGAPTWVALDNPNLGTVNPGQSASFQIVAQPPAGTAANNYPVSFVITSGISQTPGSLTVTVTNSATGSVPFHVSDDINNNVSGATVTLVNSSNPALTYKGATDANGNVTVNSVPVGEYNYDVVAPQHDAATGSVHVFAGTTPQTSVVLSFDVVSLTFTVTATSIPDVYNTQLTVTYSTNTIKPVLQVTPFAINCSMLPPTLCTATLTVTNLHPTAIAHNVTVDASKLDLGTAPQSAQFVAHLGSQTGPNLISLGDVLPGTSNAKTVVFYGSVSNGNLTTRDLGNVWVNYDFSNGSGRTPVPVRYTRPVDVSCNSINLVYDKTVSPTKLSSLDGSFTYSCASARSGVDATFLAPAGQPFAGHMLVAFELVNNAATTLLTNQANSAIWRTDFYNQAFTALKLGFVGAAYPDTAYYDISKPGSPPNTDLLTALHSVLDGGQGGPFYLGFDAQWADRQAQGADGYEIPINITTITPPGQGCTGDSCNQTGWPCLNCTVIGDGGSGGGSGTCPPGQLCGTIVVGIDQQQVFERQAFNASLGIAPATALSNVHAAVVIKDPNHNDASGQFTIVVTGDPQGATTGGTVSTANAVSWQLIPKAGAGGSSGIQYTVMASFAYTLNGTSHSTTSNAVTITVTPDPMMTVQYSVPFVMVANKNANIGVTVQNGGGGAAHNYSVSSAQPVILSNPNGLPIGFSITGSSTTLNSSTFQTGQTTILFGDIAAHGSVAGYFGLQTTYRGYIVDMTAKMTEQTYMGATLDPLVTLATPPIVFIPALGGTVTATNGPANGLVVTASLGGVTVGTDTTDQAGAYFISNLTAGSYQLKVATSTGTVLATQSVVVLPDQSTPFVDFSVTLPPAGLVSVTVATTPAGLNVTVDSVSYTAPHTFSWSAGSSHAIGTTATQGGGGTQYVFGSWSNAGAISQTITTPVSATTYTANFITQFYLTVNVSPASGGIINCVAGPTCPYAPPGYFNAGTTISITASANTGYQFASFSGALTGTTNPQS